MPSWVLAVIATNKQHPGLALIEGFPPAVSARKAMGGAAGFQGAGSRDNSTSLSSSCPEPTGEELVIAT